MFGLIDTFVLDLEGLLNGLSRVCTGDEREIIGVFLNLIRAKKFYENYKDLLSPELLSTFFGGNDVMEAFSGKTMSAEPPPSDTAGTAGSDSSTAADSPPSSEADPSSGYLKSLTSLLNDEQKETLDLLKTLFHSDTEQSEQNS